MTIKTIFLDRDGVINKEVNYLNRIEDFEFIYGIFEACRHFKKLDYQIIIITNQSGISRGYYTETDFENLTNWMLGKFKENNINILDIFHCPHLPNANCNCRKPKPGMFFEAKKIYDIDMQESWLIGDKEYDVIAANSAGISSTILVRSGHIIDEKKSNAEYIIDSINQVSKIINK